MIGFGDDAEEVVQGSVRDEDGFKGFAVVEDVRANDLEVLASGIDIYRDSLVIPSEAKESLPDLPAVFEVQTFYESMFLQMGLPITYVAFRLEHEGEGFKYPTDFDAAFWREAEGPRRSFSHQPTKKA